MKHLYTIVLISIFIWDLTAQARLTNNRLTVGSLNAATEVLEVYGDAQITGGNPFVRFKLDNPTPIASDESGLHWKNSSGNSNMRMLYSWLDDRLYVLPDTDQNAAHLSIENETGHVGINIKDPVEQLHVNGSMFITDDIRFDGSEYLQWEQSGVRQAYARFGGLDFHIANDQDGGWLLLDGDSQIKLYTDNTQRMVIKETGEVGIGTNAPTELLDVEGNVTIPSGFTYGFDEAGVQKAGVAYNGTNMFVVNLENGGALDLDAKSHLALKTNGIEKIRVALDGNVGIGLTSPAEKLHIDGGIRIGPSTGNGAGTIRYTGSDFQGRVGNSWQSLTAGGVGGTLWSSAGANAYFVGGNVGIGIDNPLHTLQVNGNIGMTGDIVGVSDVRTKKSIQDISNATSIIKELRPVSYEFESKDFHNLDLPKGEQFGFIAQELENVIPALVSNSTSTELNGVQTDLKGINYIQLIPVLTQAIQEQQTLIDAQQSQIDDLNSMVKQLTKK